MPRNPLNPRIPLVWSAEEDAEIIKQFAKIGPRKMAESGQFPGKTSSNIRSRHRILMDQRGHKRDGSTAPLRPVPQFDRQHASVWCYAQSVGASA